MARKRKRFKRRVVKPPAVSMITITDAILASMVKDPRYTAAIPCLASGATELKNVPKTCGRCKNKRAAGRAKIMNKLRGCIASLPVPQQAKVRSLLNAEKVRILKRHRGGTVKVTF